jgi:chromosome partitioning protein
MLIDFPPSLGLLAINGLAATREVIIPIDAGLFSLIGISLLTKKINEIKSKLNPSIKNVKVLLTRVDSRTNFSKTIKKSIEDIFGDNFFSTVIHQNVKISEAQSAREPVSYFDKNCRGAMEYTKLAKEIEKG